MKLTRDEAARLVSNCFDRLIHLSKGGIGTGMTLDRFQRALEEERVTAVSVVKALRCGGESQG